MTGKKIHLRFNIVTQYEMQIKTKKNATGYQPE
jgi:hypothetical protein